MMNKKITKRHFLHSLTYIPIHSIYKITKNYSKRIFTLKGTTYLNFVCARGSAFHYSYLRCTYMWKAHSFGVIRAQIARFMGPTWDPPGSCRPQMGPMLVPWTLLSGGIIADFVELFCSSMPMMLCFFAEKLQNGINILFEYCHWWKLKFDNDKSDIVFKGGRKVTKKVGAMEAWS